MDEITFSDDKRIRYSVDSEGCWNCTSHAGNSDGYPTIRYQGRTKKIFRYVFALVRFGEPHIPEYQAHLSLLHQCDNRKCINPDHMRLGTNAENVQDRVTRGRTRSKLTPDQAKEIFLDKDTPVHKLAHKYDVKVSAIFAIRGGKTWKHITEPLKAAHHV